MTLNQGQCAMQSFMYRRDCALGLWIRPDLGAQQTVCWLVTEVYLSNLCYLRCQLLRSQTCLFGKTSHKQPNKRCVRLSSKVPR